MAESTCTEFVVRKVGAIQHSPKFHPYIVCRVDGGVIAVWGSRENMANIDSVKEATPPFRMICDCIPSNWHQHDLWVYEKHNVYVIESLSDAEKTTINATAVEPIVSLGELSTWRRQIVAWVTSLETESSPVNDGLAARISGLSRSGVIPREIAALMRAVTEMRNAAEYDSKVLSKSESLAVRHAWLAVSEWAQGALR